ncbi:MAG: hypothetical protein JO251_15940 [Verrucomicrobia bacterium]|nr:hypothetical protein [Verrucomicrobiota bacterium]
MQTEKVTEIQLYRFLLDFAEKENPDEAESLSEDIKSEIDQGFALLRDYLMGEHTEDHLPIVRRFGAFFPILADAPKRTLLTPLKVA